MTTQLGLALQSEASWKPSVKERSRVLLDGGSHR